MTYAPPSGWIERTDDHNDALTRVNARFHRRNDCERIEDPRVLVQVDKPVPRPPLPRLRPRVTPSTRAVPGECSPRTTSSSDLASRGGLNVAASRVSWNRPDGGRPKRWESRERGIGREQKGTVAAY